LGTNVTREGTIARKLGAASDGTAEALFGQTKRRVLGLLFGRPDGSFYLREIVRLTGAGTGAVQRELKQLTAAGLLRRELRGRQVYFTANPEAPVYDELRSLMAKTTGVADVLRSALSPFIEKGTLGAAFIYGSVATGAPGPRSDVDLMIIGDLSLAEVIPALRAVQEQLGREVNPTIYRPLEFRSALRRKAHFLRRVLARPKLMVFGGPDDLDRLAGQSLAGGT
jgi:predicted nucleotidyltransferase